MNSKEFIMGSLCCPACRGNLTQKSDKLFCQNSYCNLEYPIISDIPIMINDT